MPRSKRPSGTRAGGAQELQFDFGAPDVLLENAAPPADDVAAPSAAAPSSPRALEASGDTGQPKVRATDFGRVALGVVVDASAKIDAAESFADEMAAGLASDRALSVSAFYARLKGAVRAAFPDEVWVTGEIRKFNESRGHRYLELADQSAPELRAEATPRGAPGALEVACWARDWPPIARELSAVGIELSAGLVVRVRGKVSIWEGGSKIRFSMTALDVEALVGGIAAARRRLLLALEAEGLLEANRRLAVPLVPLRIGLVTSPGSEAYRDFTGQLDRSGYGFDVRLEPSLVQGADAPEQVAAAIERLAAFEPDLIVVVRGGGAKGDLAAFDAERVARAIAGSPYPVWTGIGHTGDRSVADEVAQRALVTPTHCGEEVVAAVAAYLEALERRIRHIARLVGGGLDSAAQNNRLAAATVGRAARHRLDGCAAGLRQAETAAAHGALIALERARGQLAGRVQRVSAPVRGACQGQARQVAHRRELLALYDPRRQLERGWSLTRTGDGKIVRSAALLSPGTVLLTTFADGSATSTIERVELTPSSAEHATPADAMLADPVERSVDVPGKRAGGPI